MMGYYGGWEGGCSGWGEMHILGAVIYAAVLLVLILAILALMKYLKKK